MPGKERIAVYTCVTGKYDKIGFCPSSEEGVDFICLTNRPHGPPADWQTRKLQSPPRLGNGHDISRYHKIFPHHVLPEYRYSVYLDGNIGFTGSFVGAVEKIRSTSVSLAAFRHPDRRSLREESEACHLQRKFDGYDSRRREWQLRAYEDEGMRLDEPIAANYFLVRDRAHPLFDQSMSLWWSQLFEFTKRDQLSLAYVLWKTGLPWAFLDETLGADANLLTRMSHRKTRRTRAARIVPRLKKSIEKRMNRGR